MRLIIQRDCLRYLDSAGASNFVGLWQSGRQTNCGIAMTGFAMNGICNEPSVVCLGRSAAELLPAGFISDPIFSALASSEPGYNTLV
jgi:hypothetical protein